MSSYNKNIDIPSFNIPILLIVFNRPDTTSEVFKVIRNVKPSKLYIASDGARLHRDDEEKKVKLVRQLVSNIDWPCELNTLFNSKQSLNDVVANLGK